MYKMRDITDNMRDSMENIFTEYENYSSLYKESRKMHGAIYETLVKRYVKRKLRSLDVDYAVSRCNAFIEGSPNEYDLLIVKSSAVPVLGLIYEPEDVIAVLEIKAGGVYDVNSDIDRIAKAYTSAYELNPYISFGYITLWEHIPMHEYWNGKPTVNYWKLTKRYFSEKLPKNCNAIIYAMSIKSGDKVIEAYKESEFDDFVESLI